MTKLFKKIISITILFCLTFSIAWAKADYYNDYENFDKTIRINTYANKLTYYEKGVKIWEFAISSGDSENFTPEGRFVIVNKHERMLSKSAGKWMPYWMEFYNWVYWIHALPEDYNGNLDTTSTIWEVAAGGCVRLYKDEAEKLYEWAELWTYVLVKHDKKEFASLEDDIETIHKYYALISEEKYEEAFDMRLNRAYSLDTFIWIYKGYRLEVADITQTDGWEYRVKTTHYKWDTIVGRSTSKFFVSEGKIVRSYVLK